MTDVEKYIPRLKQKYLKEITPKLQKEFSYKSVMQVPKLLKIVLNKGVNGAVSDKKLVEVSVREMAQITGQKAILTYSKKDISNFKLRKGVPIGSMVTLRHNMMYEFLDRFIAVALPRIRDFRGLNHKSFDRFGNYTIGITEQIIFPEIDIDKVNKISGMDVTFVTNTTSDKVAYSLLREFGMPFKNLNVSNN